MSDRERGTPLRYVPLMDEPYREQTPDELAAQYGEGGAVAAVWTFLEMVTARNWEGVWSALDQPLGLSMVQHWLWENHGDAARDHLETVTVTDWPAFRDAYFKPRFAGMASIDLTQIGAASRPRPIGIDLELVLMVRNEGEPVQFEEPTLVEALAFVMHHTGDGWRVAALRDRLPEPGWPPTF
jgi:hypothetical protein